MKKLILLICSVLFLSVHAEAISNLDVKKNEEIEHLSKTVEIAMRRVKGAPESRPEDYLQLLPSVSVSRSAPVSTVQESETFISGSVSINKVFDINDASKKRVKLKRAGERKIRSLEFKITSLLNRKYILKRKIWQKQKIHKALNNPLEIAKFDDQLDDLSIKVEEIEMKIEQLYAEIEYVCIEVEGV